MEAKRNFLIIFVFYKLTLLNASIVNEKHDILKIVLANYIDENFDFNMKIKPLNCQPIHLLCTRKSQDLSEGGKMFFSLKNIDVNIQEQREQYSPLHLAILSSNLEIVKLLLNYPEIDVNRKNINNSTPLHIICQRISKNDNFDINFEILKLLLDREDIDIMATNIFVSFYIFFFKSNIIEKNTTANAIIISSISESKKSKRNLQLHYTF